mmetsp:Transcript_3206/g.9883  ORF Transcript_3206/g.9883 Transcript_3206/m.9883 type:complete len:284 (-) Transcript_3206:152-1003(-)
MGCWAARPARPPRSCPRPPWARRRPPGPGTSSSSRSSTAPTSCGWRATRRPSRERASLCSRWWRSSPRRRRPSGPASRPPRSRRGSSSRRASPWRWSVGPPPPVVLPGRRTSGRSSRTPRPPARWSGPPSPSWRPAASSAPPRRGRRRSSCPRRPCARGRCSSPHWRPWRPRRAAILGGRAPGSSPPWRRSSRPAFQVCARGCSSGRSPGSPASTAWRCGCTGSCLTGWAAPGRLRGRRCWSRASWGAARAPPACSSARRPPASRSSLVNAQQTGPARGCTAS